MQQDKILESIFTDVVLWAHTISHGVDKDIPHHLLEELADPNVRAELCMAIARGDYRIAPPHTGYRRKDDGSERVFLINAPDDRLLLNAINRWLMRHEAHRIHPSCKSYQAGIGIGKVVRDISKRIVALSRGEAGKIIGRKFDIHKYFDSIDRQAIHKAFHLVEEDYGASSIISLLRNYYDSDLYYDSRERKIKEGYFGIKQGCAVSAWLADALLFPLDEALSARDGIYVRYSDDILYIGEDYEEATEEITSQLDAFGLSLNEHKIADIRSDECFRFLGFDIKGAEISLSAKWVRSFKEEVDRCTILDRRLMARVRQVRKAGGASCERRLKSIVGCAARHLAAYLFHGNGRFSWATQVLPTVNVRSDLQQLTLYCVDALRAVYTGHTGIGGLGKSRHSGIQRGRGRHVKSNREATRLLETDGWLAGFLSMLAMRKAVIDPWLFRTLAADLTDSKKYLPYRRIGKAAVLTGAERKATVERLETLYGRYHRSRPSDVPVSRFYAMSLEEMDMKALLRGTNRKEALNEFESFLTTSVAFEDLIAAESASAASSSLWYWQSATYPELVLLRKWFAPA